MRKFDFDQLKARIRIDAGVHARMRLAVKENRVATTAITDLA